MTRIPEEQHRYQILAEAGLLDERHVVLKAEDAFAIFDRFGDIRPYRVARQGVFLDGTRFLSRFALQVNEHRPLLLGTTARDDGRSLVIDLTNPDWKATGSPSLAHGHVYLQRTTMLGYDRLESSIRVRSYGAGPVDIRIELAFESDFADVFELRGADRPRRGDTEAPQVDGDRVRLAYRGLDDVRRECSLQFEPVPTSLDAGLASYAFRLAAGEECVLGVSIHFVVEPRPILAHFVPPGGPPRPSGFRLASSSTEFDAWLARSEADVDIMSTSTPAGRIPYAGVPWFSTPFGRDALITALSMLWCRPDVAVGTLRFLASYQSTEDAPEADAEPGKILHELRGGEMAATREVPFARYYGSIDATPLFVVLAAEHHRRTGDRVLLDEIWPNLLRAMEWIERYGDGDGDGFVEYRQRSQHGLTNQGWKDSHDSIFHASGELAIGPIALCEVQAYVYAALRGMESLHLARNEPDAARACSDKASALCERFHRAFFCDEIGTFALALDGDKKPCRVRSSNAGHVLAMGLAEPEEARRTASVLCSPDMISGWGVRTIAQGESRFNPMAYHNGSVWPHDTALVARGLARYGEAGAATRLLGNLFAASRHFDRCRLPELFCGFARHPGVGPIAYPLACSPQSWAAASAYLLLQAALGVEIDARRHEVRLVGPRLPDGLSELVLFALSVGDVELDLRFERRGGATAVAVMRQTGDVRVVVEADRP